MEKWLRSIRDAVAMGLTWTIQWAVLAVLIGTITEFLTGYSIEKNHVDPLIALAMPGFIIGVIYSIVLSFTEKSRRFDELPLPRIAAWGTVVGLLMGVLSFALGTPRSPLWLTVVIIVVSSALLSTVSAYGSGLLFKYVARRKSSASVRSEG